jgi:hypothetical protein
MMLVKKVFCLTIGIPNEPSSTKDIYVASDTVEEAEEAAKSTISLPFKVLGVPQKPFLNEVLIEPPLKHPHTPRFASVTFTNIEDWKLKQED